MLLKLLFDFLLFIPLILATIYISGFLVINRINTNLEKPEIISLSFSIGIVLVVFGSLILSILKIRDLVLPTLILVDVFTLYRYKLKVFQPWKVFLNLKVLTLIIFFGIIIQGFINFPSGYLYGSELDFWSSQGHDGLWHISLMEEVKKNLPATNPIFSGERFYNYHYFVDILMGEFYRIYPLFSSLDLYFRFFPVVFSFLIGLSVFAFVNRWQKSQKIGYLAVLCTYFIGSFGYIVTFIHNRIIFGGETVFWAAQPNTILGNPPHALSFSLLTNFLLAFFLYFQERKKIWLALSFLIGGALAGFKVSAGIVLLAGVAAAALADVISYKNYFTAIFLIIIASSNYLIFKWLTLNGEGHLIFLPWWFIRTMAVAGDRLNWLDIELRRQYYLAQGTVRGYLRVIQIETTLFFIFLIGNIGTRLIGFYEIIRQLFNFKKDLFKNPFEIGLIITMLTGFIIPIFFVQEGIIYNNIQFFQYFILILGFYTAVTFYNLIKKTKNNFFRYLIITIMIILSVPTVIGNLVEFYGPDKTPLAKISKEEIQALNFLKNNSKETDVILTNPFNRYLKDKFSTQPRPIYAWYSTPYISALTGRPTYLTGEEQNLIMGYPIDERITNMKKFFNQENMSWNRSFLIQNHIQFIYLPKIEVEKPLDLSANNLDKVFENGEVIIYKVI